MPERRISKTQFMMGRQCLKRLWLNAFRKDLVPPLPKDQARRFEEGHAVDVLAREYFKGGKLAEAGPGGAARALERTAALMRAGADTIYEGAFSSGTLLVRCDILKRNAGGTWDLIEVKSSTGAKDEHFPDAAVQAYALEGAGVRLGKVRLMHVNGSFVKKGAIDPEKFFTLLDITGETRELRTETVRDLGLFLDTLGSGRAPDIPIGRHCSEPYDCEFRGHCWAGLPEFSIYDIPRLGWEKKDALKAMGILRFRDVPDDFDLNPAQRLSLSVEKSGRPAVDRAAIREFLRGLEYPLFHLDFETIMPAIPLYDGSRPYQQVPFQASLHVQSSPGDAPRHLEYLGDAAADPRPGLIRFLLENIGPRGSLLAYNSAFETARIKELAGDFPGQAAGLLALTGRMRDLMAPFRSQAYVHPEFKGRVSLKRVLPAMVPGMTYKGMPIADGSAAQLAYLDLLSGKLPAAEAEKIRENLKRYCGQDTLAMVKVLERLYGLA